MGFICVLGGKPGAVHHVGFPAWMKQNWGIWGGGALLADVSGVSGVEPATGGALGWAFVYAITSNIGGIATHMWSQSDYTRYARKPVNQVMAQLIMVPLATIYPQTTSLLWQPYAFLDTIHTYEDNRGTRAGVAFASIAFMISQFGIVVASNSVVAGINLAALLPRSFTVRRGRYITILFVFVIQPWSLLNTATNFLTVVGSFNVFLGPLMGIMFADYFFLRKGTMKLTDLYGTSSSSIYWYYKGWNWRAAVAWVSGVWFLMPGLVQRGVAPSADWGGWTRLYQLSWFLGVIVAGLVYLSLDRVWPIPEKTAIDDLDYFGTLGDHDVLFGVVEESKTCSDGTKEKGIIGVQ